MRGILDGMTGQVEAVDSVISSFNKRHASNFQIQRHFRAEVNHGALLVADGKSLRVLKLLPGGTSSEEHLERQRSAARVTAALRPKGYPVPVYEVIEHDDHAGYVLMTALPGQSQPDFAAHASALTSQIIELNALQARNAVLEPAWPGVMLDHLMNGGGSCYPDAMATHSQRASRLLLTLRRIAVDHADAPTTTVDIVHNDLNPGNLLADGDLLTGVVDWENTCSGDRVYDLCYLWYCIYGTDAVRPILWSAIVDLVPKETIALYLPHIIVGFASGAMTYQDESRVQIRLDAAEGALHDLSDLGVRMPNSRTVAD